MDKYRRQTFENLARMGISHDDASALVRASATLHTWGEAECNGIIQRDEDTGKPYWHSSHDGRRLGRTSDRETGALKRATAIAARYGLTAYHQGDPRGCALYLVRPGDVPAGEDVGAYYSRGVAVAS
jgi:hypothetical protein